MEEKNQFFAMPGLRNEIIRFNRLLNRFPDDHILIKGPRGTGKSYFLQIAEKHYKGRDSILKINCATIPPGLAASQLFGYAKGAFTGADKDTDGIIDKADDWGRKNNSGQGLLILEELNSLSRADQAKLLVFMETGQYYPVGLWKPKKAKIRLIATANFETKYKNRQDLIDRFGIVVDVPPLYARRDDIFYFIAKKYPNLVLNTFCLLEMYSREWIGNFRELDRFLMEIQANINRSPGFEEPLRQKLSEAVKMLSSAGMPTALFHKLQYECFDRALPTAFGGFVSDRGFYDETVPLLAPVARIKFAQLRTGTIIRTGTIYPNLANDELTKNDEITDLEDSELDFLVPFVVIEEFLREKRCIDARMLTKFLALLFGNVDRSGSITDQELFSSWPNGWNGTADMLPLPLKDVDNNKPQKLDLQCIFVVKNQVFREFVSFCEKVYSSKLKQTGTAAIDAEQVAKFLLDGDEYARFTEVVSAIKANVGHGWQEKLAKMLKVPKPTMSA